MTEFSVKDASIICSRANDKFSVLALALHAANTHLAEHLMHKYPQIVPGKDSEEGQRLLRYACALIDGGEVKNKLEQAMAAKKP